MTDRKAMQMAIEALLLPSMKTQQMLIQRDKAIIALRRALEQPEQRKPLTDEEILLAYQKQWHFHPAEEPNLAKGILQFVRAIEQAHGIGEKP